MKDISVWSYSNLGEWAKIRRKGNLHLPNPYRTPASTQKLVNAEYRRLACEGIYGGWLEDRHYLWQGTYLDQGEKYIHLGVDFDVPARTVVYATRKCRIVHMGDDHPLKGGWGPHVIVKLESGEGYLIYGHLDSADVACLGEGELLHAGEILASVGEPHHNGKWFAHLHVQFITPEGWEYFGTPDNFDKLDGYCNEHDVQRMLKYFRDPLPYVA